MLHRIYFQPIRYGGPRGTRMRMSGSFPEDVHLLPYGGATCLWPMGMVVHGCSLALSSDRSGQGAYGGVSFTTPPRPPMRGSIIAQTSSTIMPQPVWTLKCILLGG